MIVYEVIGYVGMVIVLASFTFKNIVGLRVVNMVGSLICSTYGFLTKTYPTAFLNLSLFAINLVMLIIYFKKKKGLKNEN